MASTAALPSGLRHQLTAAARRIRRLRLLQGISLLALVLLLAGGAALLLDAWLELPRLARLALFVGWAGLGIGVGVFGLLLPLCRRLDPEGLAAAIEARYPDLGERLTSTVELTGIADTHHGAPAFVALLVQETEARAHRLDVLRAFPSRRGAWLGGAALAGLVLAGLPALIWPGRYADLGDRFLFAWRTPPYVAPYRFEVTPGDTVAATGRPLAFMVQVHRLRDKTPLPRTCTWVRTDAAGNTVRRPMQVDRSDAFSFKLDQVPGDFRYHVEAGDAASPDFQVTAVQPVELAGDSPTVTITPPRYARANVDTQTVPGITDLTALQYSHIAFAFRFTRPAVAAYLEWSPSVRKGEAERPVQKYPITLTPEATAGRLELPATADGTFRVVLEAEQGIRTEPESRTLIVKPDQPPAFVKVTGHEELKAVHPYESLPIDLELADDVAMDRTELEYRVNDGPSMFEPIPLDGRGTRQARGRYTFHLAGKVKGGDVLHYRFKATDNRDVPEAGLKPNVTYHPPEDQGRPRWRILKIARQAVPLKQQEITAQHEEFERKRAAILKTVQEELAGLNKLRAEARRQTTLNPPQGKTLTQLRDQNRAVEKALNELARDADAVPELAPLADKAQELANQEMRRSEKELRQAAKEDQAARERDLQKADTELHRVSAKLEEMRRQSEAVARARLEQRQLETLADRQEQLAQRTADQAAADPIKDTKTKAKAGELKQEQQELAGELARQEQKSDALRKALDAARAEEMRQLAERARKLAEAERDLTQAARREEQKHQQDRLAALARKQQELADKAKDLAQRTERPARAAQAAPLKPDGAQKAAEALKQGHANQAIQNQDQAAHELDRIANKLEQAVTRAAEPRELARQLARAQEGLRDQLHSETRKPDAAEPLPQRVRKLQKEQEALHQAVKQLSVPAANAEVHKQHQEAAEQTAKAAKALEKGDPRQAENHMEAARRSLDQLAHKLPSLAERRAQALRELAQLRKQQREVAADADKAVREAAREKKPADQAEKLKKKLTDTAKRQAAIAERLEKLDTPSQETHRQQAGEAVKKALKDLHEAHAKAINPSQQEAQRQLERLEKALAAQKPTTPPTGAQQATNMPRGLPSRDQVHQARQLAQQQRALRAEVQKTAKAPPTLAETATQRDQQQKLRQQTGELTQNLSRLGQEMPRTPQAQQQVRQATHFGQQAQDAMQRAEDQVRQGQSEPARNSQQQAAYNLDQVAHLAEQSAASLTTPGKNPTPGKGQPEMTAKTGQNLQQAQSAMHQAQQHLGQGQNQSAQNAMQQAAQALQQAARQLAQAQQPGQPAATTQVSKMGASGQGRPDPSLFGKDLKQYAGKSWGELPGELRTKILQDMKARYGEDYARIIKLYFEELADRKP